MDEEKAVTNISRHYRGHAARKEVQKKRNEQAHAATAIQSRYRGYQARKEVNQKKSVQLPLQEGGGERPPPTADYSRLQTPKTPGETDREMAAAALDELATTLGGGEGETVDVEQEEAAVKIQSQFRMFKAKREVKEKREKRVTGASSVAAHKAMMKEGEVSKEEKADAALAEKTNALLMEKEKEKEELEDAALKIQSMYRGHRTRAQVKQEREERQGREEQFLDNELEKRKRELNDHQAATRIQARYRGHIARKANASSATKAQIKDVSKSDVEEKEKAKKKKQESVAHDHAQDRVEEKKLQIAKENPDEDYFKIKFGEEWTAKDAKLYVESVIRRWSPNYSHHLAIQSAHPQNGVVFKSVWSKPTPQRPIPRECVTVDITLKPTEDVMKPEFTYTVEGQMTVHKLSETFNEKWLDFVIRQKGAFRGNWNKPWMTSAAAH
uniref:Uncharacterized protein n=1 Tax=Palpitomonas bilix TaxID=652834 RepID=A0A7S3D6C0_9EUKA|mmetsp:Transcript_23907/g.60458  ORF Transcript_23907/g.60458 Transcript_23907/m.60458 type:complete len:441 (+) Transcript_23907:330-1652(+)